MPGPRPGLGEKREMNTPSMLNSLKETVVAVVHSAGERNGLGGVLDFARGAPLLTVCFLLLGFTAAVLALRGLGRVPLALRAVAWSAPFSRRLSHWVGSRAYLGDAFFLADGAQRRWLERRRAGLERLAATLRERAPRSIDWGKSIQESFSDLRFTDANRVPFRFARVMRETFDLSTVVTASRGPRLCDLDGRWNLDVSGSYGVNVAGYETYKEWMERGLERVRDLGPVLGPLHPCVAENIESLRAFSKLDEVSFHASGTEAVMAAVRLARFNTERRLIVCFAGAYHGWWDGVQPSLGSERAITDCLTLRDMSPASLELIRRRAGEIAAVLVNPVQSFHPNAPPPNDAVLLTSSVRKAEGTTTEYGRWLRSLREVCTAAAVPLLFDEVYSGFRLAVGGAQEYFGVQADMVVYGKTVAGGMPIGVVCGRRELMRRFDPERPMRIAYVIGTFSAHPVVMSTMNEFLRWASKPDTADLYALANRRTADWASETNRALDAARLPLRVVHLGTIWTLEFTAPGRYHWLLQYYLRAQGVTLSWVGTGRCLMSLDFQPSEYAELTQKLLSAALSMKQDGWWIGEEEEPGFIRRMNRRLASELLGSLVRFPRAASAFYREVMRRKHDDHVASHSHLVNRIGHLLSSSAFLSCYYLVLRDPVSAMCIGLPALFVRQIGHAIFEPPCHDKEKLLLGFTTRSKTLVVGAYLLIPILHLAFAGSLSRRSILELVPTVAQEWLVLTIAVVLGHVAMLAFTHGLRNGLVWLVKLVTDPMTDLLTYTAPVARALRSRIIARPQPGV
jgi:glutamate-1-semialdehyde 2,1-aminomutase